MVNIYANVWTLILLTLSSNHWCEINCSIQSYSYDDTSKCDSDSEYSSRHSLEDGRIVERIWHKPNKRRLNPHRRESEYTNNSESEQQGLAIYHEDLDHNDNFYDSMELHHIVHNQPMEFARTIKSKIQEKQTHQAEPNTIQYETIASNGNVIYYRVGDDSIANEVGHTTDGATKDKTYSTETSLNIKLTTSTKKKTHRRKRIFKATFSSIEDFSNKNHHSSKNKVINEKSIKRYSNGDSNNSEIIYYKTRNHNENFNNNNRQFIDKAETKFREKFKKMHFMHKTSDTRYSNTDSPNGKIIYYKTRNQNENFNNNKTQLLTAKAETNFRGKYEKKQNMFETSSTRHTRDAKQRHPVPKGRVSNTPIPHSKKTIRELITKSKSKKRNDEFELNHKEETRGRLYSNTESHNRKIIYYKTRNQNENFDNNNTELITAKVETNFRGRIEKMHNMIKTSNTRYTRDAKQRYSFPKSRFNNTPILHSNKPITGLITKSILKKGKDEFELNHKEETRSRLSLKDILSEHGLNATQFVSKTIQQFTEKRYGMTTHHLRKPNFDQNELDMDQKRERAKIKIKPEILRSTRLIMPDVFELKDENPEESSSPADMSSPAELTATEELSSTIAIATSPNLPQNTESMEDLSPYAIEKQMKRLILKHREKMNITMEIIGRTVEYNDIVLLKITEAEKLDAYFRVKDNKYADQVEQKKIIFIVHGLSVIGMRYLISNEEVFNKLLLCYTNHLDKFDIFLIPMANPDGYAATCNSQSGQYWNKNMSPQNDCPGVALDRNFDVAWNNSNTMKISSCSPMYPGPVPFSEAETKAVQKVLHLYAHRIIAYIHVHASSYDPKVFKGDAVLYPRGYTEIQTDDDRYVDLRGEIDEAIKNSSFRVLSVTTDTLYNWYGTVKGTSVDYASTVYGIPYSLEFAMQVYKDIQIHAVDTLWRRVIDVVFDNIWKYSQKSDDY